MAAQQPGFLGVETARGAAGLGITVSYWTSEEAIANWKKNAEHRIAQELGKHQYYAEYHLQICELVRESHKEAKP